MPKCDYVAKKPVCFENKLPFICNTTQTKWTIIPYTYHYKADRGCNLMHKRKNLDIEL